MTYNEWRDELKSNLLSVSESERRRVLDYYAEAYADRRDAGYSEREIIEDFGAPYDAARRILEEKRSGFSDDIYFDEPERDYNSRRERRREKEMRRESRREEREERRRETRRERDDYDDYAPERRSRVKEDYTWVFVLLCIVFCIPLFGIIMGMVGITIGLFTAPFALLVSAVATMGAGIGAMIGGELILGAVQLGIGLIIFGVSVILIPLFVSLVKLMWKLFRRLFAWIKSHFAGREAY